MKIETLDSYRALLESLKRNGFVWASTSDNKEVWHQWYEITTKNPKHITITIEFEEKVD